MKKDLQAKSIFILLFAIVGLISMQIPFTHLMGSKVSFTLFDFFGPVAGAFLGPLLGVFTVLAVELVNLAMKPGVVDTGVIIRLFPMLAATYYFAVFSKNKNQNRTILLVPLTAMVVFILHPIGRAVWYFSLFWLIPVIAYFKRDNLFVKSLGSTFTAHAVGGAAWIWAFNLPVQVWNSLIPIVIQERLLFAVGISVSYFVLNQALKWLIAKKILPEMKLTATS